MFGSAPLQQVGGDTVLTLSTVSPADFWTVLSDNWDLFSTGLVTTLKVVAICAVLSLLLGGVLAAMRVSPVPALRASGASYVNVVRNTPLTLVFLFIFFGMPTLEVKGMSPLWVAVASLTLYTSAFVCEALRAGINTVPVGQAEASRALGMRFTQTLSLVVLPQAFRSVVPPLASVLIAMAKNSTIAAGFGLDELGSLRNGLNERGEDTLVSLTWIAVFFLLIVLPMAWGASKAERRLAVRR